MLQVVRAFDRAPFAEVPVDDADAMEAKLQAPLVKGGFYHAGQVCVSTQRIYVHEAIFSEFNERLIARVASLRTGAPRWGHSIHHARHDPGKIGGAASPRLSPAQAI